MMNHIKKEYQPDLDPISQILQLQSLTILKPARRQGLLRKEGGFFSTWKQKLLKIIFVPEQKLVCQVYPKGGEKPEEVIDLISAKLSKRCSEVDDHICFGLVTPSNQKYLLALKSNRECLKVFYQIVSAKKIFRNSMFVSTNLIKRISQDNLNNKNKDSQKLSPKKKGGESPFTKSQSIKKIQQHQKQLNKKQSPSQFLRNKQYKQPSQQSQPVKIQNVYHINHSLYLRDQFIGIEELKGFKKLSQFSNGTVYQNQENIAKANLVIYSPESAKQILQKFYQINTWNHKIKQLKYITMLQKGVYKFYLQFWKKGCFSEQKFCQIILSLSKFRDDYYLSMISTPEIPKTANKKNWIDFKLLVKIKIQKNNPREKLIYFSVTSSQHHQVLIEFANEIQQFQSFIKSKVKPSDNILQIRTYDYQ